MVASYIYPLLKKSTFKKVEQNFVKSDEKKIKKAKPFLFYVNV
jgi:hypothetical protein